MMRYLTIEYDTSDVDYEAVEDRMVDALLDILNPEENEGLAIFSGPKETED